MFDKIIHLCAGAGNGVDTACLMTASNMLVGNQHRGDAATCQCDMLRAFIVLTNDAMPQNFRDECYGPLVYEIIGTRTDDPNTLKQRAFAFADWAVREVAPLRLDWVGRHHAAATLRGLPKIVDKETAHISYRQSRDYDFAANKTAWNALDGYNVYAGSCAASVAMNAASNAEENNTDPAVIWRMCAEIIMKVAAIGDKRPVELAMDCGTLADRLAPMSG